MTLTKRNILFKGGICAAGTILAALAAAAFVILPAYPAEAGETARRAGGILQGLAARLFPPAPYAVLASIAASALYALVSLILILRSFEKTNAPEICFVAIFTLSFAFEGIRALVPLKLVRDFPGLYLTMMFRALLFARYGGIFSLFAASVSAAGLKVQKQRNIILAIIVVALIIALGAPIDALAWDTSLCLISGYGSMFKLMEGGLALITVGSFLISAYSRGSREYILVGTGSLLAFLGRNILLNSDTWLSPLPGLFCVALGTWFICAQIHRIYLWL
jgi:hypothetical protein